MLRTTRDPWRLSFLTQGCRLLLTESYFIEFWFLIYCSNWNAHIINAKARNVLNPVTLYLDLMQQMIWAVVESFWPFEWAPKFSKMIPCLLRTLKTDYQVQKNYIYLDLFCVLPEFWRVGKDYQGYMGINCLALGNSFPFRPEYLQNDGRFSSLGNIPILKGK